MSINLKKFISLLLELTASFSPRFNRLEKSYAQEGRIILLHFRKMVPWRRVSGQFCFFLQWEIIEMK